MKQFFKKNQKVLLQIANNPYTKWILGLDKIPYFGRNIDGITPNSLHLIKSSTEVETIFYQKEIFAQHLSKNIFAFDYFQSKVGQFKLVNNIPELFITSTDFNPHSGAVSPCDGEVTSSPGSHTWATVRDAASGTAHNSSDAQQTPYSRDTGTAFVINRTIVNFDTSAIGSTPTISSAEYHAYCEGNDNGDSVNNYITLVASTPAATSDVANSDFSQVGTTEFVTHILTTGLTVGSMNTFTFNGSGIAAINKTGVSSFALREGHDFSNTPITSGFWTYAVFTSADGASNFPFLRVVYSVPSTTNASFLLNFI